jgi:hypothetical protein
VGVVHGTDTTTAHGVLGEQVVGLQILQTLDATERYAASAIGSTGCDDIAKIGIPALHGNEAALFVAAQIANVVCDGWNVFGAFSTRHVSDGHFVILWIVILCLNILFFMNRG